MPLFDAMIWTLLYAFAGAMGGVVRWLYKNRGWKEGVTHLVTGCLTAAFTAPALKPVFQPIANFSELDPYSTAMFMGFMIGVLGVAVPAFFIDFFDKRSERLVDAERVNRFTGGEVEGPDADPSPSPPSPSAREAHDV